MPRYRQVKIDGEWVLVDANAYQEPEITTPYVMGDTGLYVTHRRTTGQRP